MRKSLIQGEILIVSLVGTRALESEKQEFWKKTIYVEKVGNNVLEPKLALPFSQL